MRIMNLVSTTVVLFLVLIEINANFMAGSGPYYTEVEYFIPCSDQGVGTMKYWSQKYRLQSGNGYSHRGGFIWPFEMEDVKDLTVHVVIDKWSTDWKLYTNFDGTFCKGVELLPDFLESLTLAIGVDKTCFIPKGNYTFEDWKVKANCPKIPVAQYGKYRADIQIISKKEVQCCWQMFFENKQKFN